MMGDVVLYILMRSDLASLNPGKACAQATHAANQCVARLPPGLEGILRNWEGDRGFGTCIVLSVRDPDDMRGIVSSASEEGLHAGVTHDPEYPLQDGAFTHLIPLDTCAYLFGERRDLAPFVGHLPLMP